MNTRIGINYGHHLKTYSQTDVDEDLNYLKSLGFTKIRIAMPTYSGNPIDYITPNRICYNVRQMSLRAKAFGF